MTKTLGGRPINDHAGFYATLPKDQAPIEEFVTALDALLAFPEVEAVRWEQYTPYFNDGDACEFRIYDASVKLVGVPGRFIEDGIRSWPPNYFDTHAYRQYGRWNPVTRQNDRPPMPEGKVEVNYDDLRCHDATGTVRLDIEQAYEEFGTALMGGQHYVKLLDLFGDPAQVTATREGFSVEHYDHD